MKTAITVTSTVTAPTSTGLAISDPVPGRLLMARAGSRGAGFERPGRRRPPGRRAPHAVEQLPQARRQHRPRARDVGLARQRAGLRLAGPAALAPPARGAPVELAQAGRGRRAGGGVGRGYGGLGGTEPLGGL